MKANVSQAILTASSSRTQIYTAIGDETSIKLQHTLIYPYCNILIFKNGVKLVKDIDYKFLNLNGTEANENTKIITTVQFNTPLVALDIISIDYSLFGGEYVDLEDIKTTLMAENAYGGFPLGTIFTYSGKDIPTGSLPCIGQSIIDAKRTYPEFYNWVVENAPTISLSEYEAYLLAHNNECGYYGLNATEGTIRLPLISNYIKNTHSLDDIGTSKETVINTTNGTVHLDSVIYRAFVKVYSAVEPNAYIEVGNLVTDIDDKLNIIRKDKVTNNVGLLPYNTTLSNDIGYLLPSVIYKDKQYIRPVSSDHNKIVITSGTYLSIDVVNPLTNKIEYIPFGTQKDITFNVANCLDTGQIIAGKDYYIYLVAVSKTSCDIKVSLNSTYPLGYTATNSRKIGGFHTLCTNAGTISGHKLSGYNAGNILPNSVWDLSHRAATCSNVGMTYDPTFNIWVDIYMQSGTGASTTSAFAATASTNRQYDLLIDDLRQVGKQPLSDIEFSSISDGSNQRTNILGSANPVTTGGHYDTANRRMISHIGCEDCCGVFWQVLRDIGFNGQSGWGAGADNSSKGQYYGTPYGLIAGGYWVYSSYCGSRCRCCDAGRLRSLVDSGCRGCAPNVH